jgi:hypothetical protein
MTRREALRACGGALSGAALSPALLALLETQALGRTPSGPSPKLVVLWLEGGPSQLETFDPKPGSRAGGPTKAIQTDVPGWLLADSLPGLAARADRLCVLRSLSSKEGNHARARDYVKTGYTPNPSVSYPAIGSIVSSQLGASSSDLPGFVQIDGAGGSAGFLGIEHAPFVINDPEGKIQNLTPAAGVDSRRLDHRLRMLEVVEDEFADRGGGEAVSAGRTLRRRARRMMESKQLAAFDLDQEKEKVRDRYGRNRFGQGCLLARRLLEAGVPAVEVVLGGWDTHDDNFQRTRALNQILDPAFSALLDDLRTTGLEEETVVLCLGEFGRTPEINAVDGRGHWPRNWCAALAGRGIRTGQAIGATDDEGATILGTPLTVPDLYVTLAKVLGFDPDRSYVASRRPITLVDPEGREISELLA